MENLPTPLSRVELYLAKACGMDVTVPEQPLSRLEQFLAILAGDTSITMPTPMSLTEQWLAYVLGVTPDPLLAVEGACLIGAQKVDVRYFARAAGMPGSPDIPEPQNRTEQYWYQIASNVPIVGFLKYATGISMTLTDILSGIEELQFVYGDTYQQTYSGKNLFNINDNSQSRRSSKTIDGNKLTVTCTTDGTAYTVIELPNSDALLGKTCQLKVGNISVTSGSSTTQGMIRVLASLKTNLTDLAGDEYGLVRGLGDNIEGAVAFPNSYPDGKDCFVLVVYVGNRGGSTVVGEYGDYEEIQLELGSTATSYEPYVGGIPAPNPDYPQDIDVVTGEQTVDVYGKNLFDKNNVNQYMGYFDGNADNPILVNGTTNRNRVIYIKCKPSTAYSISLTNRNGINSPQVGTTDSLPSNGLAVTKLGIFESGSLKLENLTTSATAQYIVIRFQTNPSTVRFDDISQALLAGLQIEQSSTATAYEPYQGQSYEINLGKNLWGGFSADMTRTVYDIDFNNLANGDIFVAAGTSSGQANSLSSSMVAGTDRLLTLEAGTYTISGATGVIRVQLVNNTGTTLASDTGNGATVTLTSATQAFVRVSFDGGQTVTDTTIHPQLEKGSTATSYAPYFTPIELCKLGDYQDYIYKSGDGWYIHKEVGDTTINGSETFGRNSFNNVSGWHYYYTKVLDSLVKERTNQAFSNNYRNLADVIGMDEELRPGIFNDYSSTPVSSYMSVRKNLSSATNILRFSMPDSTTSSVDSFKTWLSTHNTTIYYILATPTDTKITDATLVGQLEALDSAVLPKPNANITVTASDPNLPGAIKISYYTRHE